jgi:hypothetical protein
MRSWRPDDGGGVAGGLGQGGAGWGRGGGTCSAGRSQDLSQTACVDSK